MSTIDRRTFLASGTAAWSTVLGTAAETKKIKPTKIIDTHVHFYDPTRPQGVPWPPKDDKVLYRPVLPSEFRKLTKPLGVTGVIEVEASPLSEDNQWVLDLAKREPIIIGTVGDLEPEKPEFSRQLERFHRDRRFRGIRCGDLWGRDFSEQLADPKFIAGLKLLAQVDLEMDTANPTPALLAAIVRLNDKIPNLRIVIDHLPIDAPADQSARAKYEQTLSELGKRTEVYVKVSTVLRRVNGRVPEDVDHYRPELDELWETFGPDRLMYGSNWPVSNLIAPYQAVIEVVKEYFSAKGQDATDKYFWRNATSAYRLG